MFFLLFLLSPRLIGTVGATLIGFRHTAFFANRNLVETVEVKITRLTVVSSFVKPATAVRAGQFEVVFWS